MGTAISKVRRFLVSKKASMVNTRLNISAEKLTLRLTVRVQPGKQFVVQRALNATVSEALGYAPTPPAGAG